MEGIMRYVWLGPALLLVGCGNPPPEKLKGKWQHKVEPVVIELTPDAAKPKSGHVKIIFTDGRGTLIGTYALMTSGFKFDVVNTGAAVGKHWDQKFDITFDDDSLVLTTPGTRDEFRRIGN
jgi:hypothetical protein